MSRYSTRAHDRARFDTAMRTMTQHIRASTLQYHHLRDTLERHTDHRRRTDMPYRDLMQRYEPIMHGIADLIRDAQDAVRRAEDAWAQGRGARYYEEVERAGRRVGRADGALEGVVEALGYR
ncbi:hypothetical protein HBI56_161830 [Parastagonospora nodorum]|uniref:Uncharacterized protein n=1 Tax=Phaeosphaeria nodorum (strain SN15 / ATCC MYA-4574 / FGSC 10173) TaxID=321614 RepID=Q0U4C6_PHANO|nr:hypothetical protein SNOG_13388 [Parastagonospora nodorum SN15]KAH3905933.1 hypothetical protein HBH56_210810 [Parastagonospora nodorum]EAT79272.1 hypothetical protein SNOG_13388 [Parastagonospora nodorum SN15]KAH3931559.1 hypothetical protein HBH54_099420 [Parastagonospora nodorum]KAH3944403.1 hypothetical protein HBH53_160870 [Parastagonospora nodorum]KAH3960648.1 hypothetical protein HBH51_189170 [Parastagonospora nodorum]